MAFSAFLVGSWSALHGQDIVVGDGFEAFPYVEYQGGDSGYPKKLYGFLVLTDSTVALHACWNRYCEVNKKKGPFKIPPYFSIRLTDLKDVSNSSRVRGPDVATKLALGLLAGDRTEEFVGFVYETERTAEAPVFKTQKTQAAAIEAKIRFRLKKLGVTVPGPA